MSSRLQGELADDTSMQRSVRWPGCPGLSHAVCHAAARRSQTTRAPHFPVSLGTLHGLHCAGCEPGFLGDPCGAECTARSKGTQLIDAG